MIAIEVYIAVAEPNGVSQSFLQPMLDWFDLDDPWRKGLVLFGFLGQLIFFGRWIVQWIASERRGESHVPELFWWCSLVGAMMLFTYFVIDRDPVGILGQSVGWIVYSRNLYLIKVKRGQRGKQAAPPAPNGKAQDAPASEGDGSDP